MSLIVELLALLEGAGLRSGFQLRRSSMFRGWNLVSRKGRIQDQNFLVCTFEWLQTLVNVRLCARPHLHVRAAAWMNGNPLGSHAAAQ